MQHVDPVAMMIHRGTGSVVNKFSVEIWERFGELPFVSPCHRFDF